jgi:hypothetical protein
MALQEHHDFANSLLVGPTVGDAGEPDLADTAHLEQSARRLLDDVEHRLTEGSDQPLGEMRADPLDQPGGEIALDALTRRGRRHLQEQRAKLRTVLAVLLPMAAGLDVLSGMDLGSAAEHGDEIAVAAHLHPQHTEAALGVMEGHALHQPRKGFALLRLTRRSRHSAAVALLRAAPIRMIEHDRRLALPLWRGSAPCDSRAARSQAAKVFLWVLTWSRTPGDAESRIERLG